MKGSMKRKMTSTVILMMAFSLGFGMLGLARYTHNQRQVAVAAPVGRTLAAHDAITEQPTTKLEATTFFTKDHPASMKPVITWSDNDRAVVFELELATKDKAGQYEPFFTSTHIYTNGYNVSLPEGFSGTEFSWRVRGLSLDLSPVSEWSDWNDVYVDKSLPVIQKPILTSIYNQGYGEVLLYPVYNWIPVNGAVKYEIEILDEPPENPNGIEPSAHRIDAIMVDSAEHYDAHSRYSEQPFYWRVRGIDGDGKPVGVYSDAGSFVTNPAANYGIATYGDSITHGGGSISYAPSDWNFSYQHYLNFESINLAQSGDTSTMTVERFERDVLPFHPRYLIILMGSNSLRAGVSSEEVIADMKELKKKCLDNGILPVFLTLPPINPDNIQRAFDEPTASGWQQRFAEVNAFIMSQVHIDDAAGMASPDGTLPTRLGLDGLHLDPPGKKMMADAINAAWPDIINLPESAFQE